MNDAQFCKDNRLDTYKIKSASYDSSEDILLADVFLAASPNHDAPYETFDASPIRFAIMLDFSNNAAHIDNVSSDTFQANASYVPNVLFSFSVAVESAYNDLDADCAPIDAFDTLKEFNVPF